MTLAVLWLAMAGSMIAWAWSSVRGGRLPDREFVWFSAALVAGQAAGAVEAFSAGALGTTVSQVYFLVFTVWGVLQRVRMRQATPSGGGTRPSRQVGP